MPTTISATRGTAPEAVTEGTILVRNGDVLRLIDAAGNLVRERVYDDRAEVAAVFDGGCLLVQVGRQAWHLTTTDLRSDAILGSFNSPAWYWSAFEASRATVAVESDGSLLVVDPQTCSYRSLPAASWPEGYVSSDGRWLIPERKVTGAAVIRMDPKTGAAAVTEYGWATVEMAEAVMGVPLPGFRDAVRVSPPAALSDGSIGLFVETGSEPYAATNELDIVVLEPDGTEQLRVNIDPRASVPLFDVVSDVIVVGDGSNGPEHDVIDLQSGERLGGSYGAIGISQRWIVGDLLITANRPSRPSAVLDLSAGVEIDAPNGRIKAISPDARWLAVQDNGVIVVPIDEPDAGIRIADGIPITWFGDGEHGANTPLDA